MVKCSVSFCKGEATFTFPREEKRRTLWENAINENFRSTKSSRLCENHFEKDEIIINHESYHTGVLSSKKYLKPTAVPTLRLNLGMEKAKRLEKIRKSLFEYDSDSSSSSLSISLLDESTIIVDNNCTQGEEILAAATDLSEKVRNSLLPNQCFPLSNYVSADRNDIETPLLEEQESNEVLFQENIAQNVEVVTSTISESGQLAKTVLPPVIENKEELLVKDNQELHTKKEKTVKSKGVQAARGFMSVASICHRDSVVHYFTGLESYEKFCFVYGTLSDYVNDIKYTQRQVKCVPPEDMFLLTLTKLRRNIPDFGLGFYFGISETLVSNIFNTWIRYIYQLCSLLDTWPSREIVDFYMPKGFQKHYSSTRVIVDATEMPIAKPSNPVAQQSTFSTYKNRNTVKVLVGATPGGLLCYNSTAYGGSTSDRQIVERCNLVQKCQPGDSIMADRGFNVDDICQSHGVLVNIPHFLKGKQLPGITVLSDRKLASKRVHIERLIGLTKTYKILQEPLNPSYTRLATEIFSICLMLCNFRECIVSQKA